MNFLVIGASSGIGKAVAENYAQSKKNKIFVCSRNEKKLEDLYCSYPNISYFGCDATNEEELKKLERLISSQTDKIDIVINSIGDQGEIGKTLETDFMRWVRTFEVNLFSIYLICKTFKKFLLKSKNRKVINFSGGGAFNPFPNYSAYACSKAALVRLTENLAQEYHSENIQFNNIAPGFVVTDIHKKTLQAGKIKAGEYFEETKERLEDQTKTVPVERVLKCIDFLISSKSTPLNGKTISASFDPWDTKEFQENIKLIQDSDLYTLQRINLENLNTSLEVVGKLKKFI